MSIDTVLHEKRLFPPSPEFVTNANVSGLAAYQAPVSYTHLTLPTKRIV